MEIIKEVIKIKLQKSITGDYTAIAEENLGKYKKGDSVQIITEAKKTKLEHKLKDSDGMVLELISFTDLKTEKLEKALDGEVVLETGRVSVRDLFNDDIPSIKILGIKEYYSSKATPKRVMYDYVYGFRLSSGLVLNNMDKIIFDFYKIPIKTIKIR